MVDVKAFSFDYPGDASLVVYHDQHGDFRLVGRTRDGHAAVSLASENTLSAISLDLNEPTARIFLGGCRLEVDAASVINRSTALPAGALVLAAQGSALVVRSAGRDPILLNLAGGLIGDASDGFPFSRWSIVRNRESGPPESIFEHDALPVSSTSSGLDLDGAHKGAA